MSLNLLLVIVECMVVRIADSVLIAECGVLKIEIEFGGATRTTRCPHCVWQPPNRPNCSKQGQKTRRQSNVGGGTTSNKYQPHHPGRHWNSNLEVYEGFRIAGVLVPPMHVPKGPPKKKENMRGS